MLQNIESFAVHVLGGIGHKKILKKIIEILLTIMDRNINFCNKKLFNFFSYHRG